MYLSRLALSQPSLLRCYWRGLGRWGLLVQIVTLLLFAPQGLATAVEVSSAKPQNSLSQSFDYVVLALSWSPTYCASSAKRSKTAQCQNGTNRGFVVHGLWPQANDGSRLRCAPSMGAFSKALFERAVEIFPDVNLAQAQWQRHGQCFGFSADAYLEWTAKARAKLVIPDSFKVIDKPASVAPEKIRTDFVAANIGLQNDSISVSCRKSELVEVLVCLKSDLSNFVPCPLIVKRSCRAPFVQIPAFQNG